MNRYSESASEKTHKQSVENLDGSVTELTYFDPGEDTMRALLGLLFTKHWRVITVGPCVEGSVFEVRFKEPPKLSILDGYLTVDLGNWHFHLCIGEHKGTPSEELARKRRVSRAAFFETRGGGCGSGHSWGLRLWNGFDQQMTTVFLPSPYLSDESKPLKEPQWARLRLWHELRQTFLGEPMPSNFNPGG